ncbi:hypothetical protein J6590_086775 [Homalodisca vitripennis]|nr:hypothetical protein J6590_086775 [Homalodisca vitripennis]
MILQDLCADNGTGGVSIYVHSFAPTTVYLHLGLRSQSRNVTGDEEEKALNLACGGLHSPR